MEQLITLLFFNLSILMGIMFFAWLLSLYLKNAGIIDIFWGVGFIVVAWMSFFITDGYVGRKLLVTAAVTAWGLRLSIHLFLRNFGIPEDRRYAAIRKKMGKNFWWRSLFEVFAFQAVLLWLISLTVQVAQISPAPDHLGRFDIAGLTIWLIGFVMESISDQQLTAFKADPENRDKVMDKGLWRYSRHPNYFGETLVWWGIFLMGISVPGGIGTLISPALITFLVLRVSGVPLLEKNMSYRRPGYKAYIRRTSSFVPWFPGKN
jgi:steroid 5-alpha reductase family enzyme